MNKVGKLESYRLVAERLNAKGILPFSARQWSQALVQQSVYGKVNYPEVMQELKELMIELNLKK
jgi:hypothetical protein